MSSYKSQTFMDAQLVFAKSKHGKAQKRKDRCAYHYQCHKQAAKRITHGNGGSNDNR